MSIPLAIKAVLLEAESKALASAGEHGINVVPVSTIFVENENILLVDYFFKKTAQNLLMNNKVALVCWKGLEGYQIKGTCEYSTQEDVLLPIQKWAKDKFPEREVKAVLIISPEKIYSVAAKVDGGQLVWAK